MSVQIERSAAGYILRFLRDLPPNKQRDNAICIMRNAIDIADLHARDLDDALDSNLSCLLHRQAE